MASWSILPLRDIVQNLISRVWVAIRRTSIPTPKVMPSVLNLIKKGDLSRRLIDLNTEWVCEQITFWRVFAWLTMSSSWARLSFPLVSRSAKSVNVWFRWLGRPSWVRLKRIIVLPLAHLFSRRANKRSHFMAADVDVVWMKRLLFQSNIWKSGSESFTRPFSKFREPSNVRRLWERGWMEENTYLKIELSN